MQCVDASSSHWRYLKAILLVRFVAVLFPYPSLHSNYGVSPLCYTLYPVHPSRFDNLSIIWSLKSSIPLLGVLLLRTCLAISSFQSRSMSNVTGDFGIHGCQLITKEFDLHSVT